jgi:hypothetical protein
MDLSKKIRSWSVDFNGWKMKNLCFNLTKINRSLIDSKSISKYDELYCSILKNETESHFSDPRRSELNLYQNFNKIKKKYEENTNRTFRISFLSGLCNSSQELEIKYFILFEILNQHYALQLHKLVPHSLIIIISKNK